MKFSNSTGPLTWSLSEYGGKYVVMQYALRLTTEQISTFTGDLYPNDLV